MWMGAEYRWQFSPLIHLCTWTTADWHSPHICYPLLSPFRQYLAEVIPQYDCKAIHYYCKVRYSSPPFLMAQEPLMMQGHLIIEALRSHSDTPQSVGLLWRVIRPSQRPLPDNTQQSQETDIHSPDWIRTRNPSKRAAANSRLRPHGHWHRQVPVATILKI